MELAALLDELEELVQRFIVLPEGGPVTAVLWIAFTYVLDGFDTAPLLVLASPVKQCGKTKTLEFLGALARRALPASNLTASAVYRVIEKHRPTLLMDEADTYALDNDGFRGVINSGHTRSAAFVLRCVGDDAEPRKFSTWCPKAIALIGTLPSTLEDRSLTIPMRRRTSTERIERLRRGRIHRDLEPLRRRLVRWAQEAPEALMAVDPSMPEGLDNQQEDNWRPLLAVADLAGGAWPIRAREAARTLVGVRAEDSTQSLQLLADVNEVLAEGEERVPSAELVARLAALADRPWCEYSKGKPLTQNGLAGLLRGFGVKPKTIRCGVETLRGYERKDLTDLFTRYLPGLKPQQAQQMNGDEEIAIKTDPQHERVLRMRNRAQVPIAKRMLHLLRMESSKTGTG